MRLFVMIALCAAMAGTEPAFTASESAPGPPVRAAIDPEDEFITTQNAILCVDPGNLHIANEPTIAESLIVLRAMGCVRIGSGARTRLLEEPELDGPWRIRLYPEGISRGVMLWGLSSAFTTPGGSKFRPTERAGP
jgi:hypothetical protein